MSIKVSIIIPSYNVGPYIVQCLESVRNQSLRDIEIICVDAGSMDGTQEEILKAAAVDARIQYIHSKVKSYGYQVNLGINAAVGDYISIVESDDYISEDMYRILYDIAANTGVDIVKSDYNRIIDSREGERSISVSVLGQDKYYNEIICLDEIGDEEKKRIFLNDCNIWNGIYRRTFIIKNCINCNETSGAAFQDIGFVLQSLVMVDKIYYVDIPLYQYRFMREGSSTLNPNILKFVWQEIEFLLEKKSVKSSDCFYFVIFRLANIFVHEYRRISSKYEFDSHYIKENYMKIVPWFKDVVLDISEYKMLINIPESYTVFLNRISACRATYERNFADKYRDKTIVIVGCGQRGRTLKELCDKLGLHVIACCDNNPTGNAITVDKSCKLYPDATYLIASKFYAKELFGQLMGLGIRKSNIEVYRPFEKVILYGAGKVGRRCQEFLSAHKMEPVCFLDGSKIKDGEYIGSLPVINADEFLLNVDRNFIEDCTFLISMATGCDEVKDNLLEVGAIRNRIYKYDTNNELLDFFMPRLVSVPFSASISRVDTWNNVYFDLGNGVVLGGVESWSAEMGGYLQTIGKDVKYVAPKIDTDIYDLSKNSVVGLVEDNNFGMLDHCLETVKNMIGKDNFVYVCNFCNIMLDLVVWLKRNYIKNIKIIAVVHNDMDVYYRLYSSYIDSINCLLYMSRKQKKVLREKYFVTPDIMKYLGWHISCESHLYRDWSTVGRPLKIGYAGRLIINQKRSDLLLNLILLLCDKGLDLHISIAGDGDYKERMEKELYNSNLLDKVVFLGMLPKSNMLSFWKEQDIMISCSDWEGNSISKSEAMAAGAVPVVTDTSGASDDIIQGKNGYIVPLGDINSMVSIIEKLYNQRECLPVLGKAAHEKILENNGKFDVKKFWEELLESQ